MDSNSFAHKIQDLNKKYSGNIDYFELCNFYDKFFEIMEIVIDIDKCKRIEGMSCYNSNYYKLPFVINDCDIFHEKYDGGDYFQGGTIGKIEDEKYTLHYYLNCEPVDNKFIFDSHSISVDNHRT